MPGRIYNGGNYRYGFNGKENDNEVKGNGNQYDYGFRIYDPRLGKFLSVDPLFKGFPFYTPYQFAGNMPIWAIDLDGLEQELKTRVVDIFNITISQPGKKDVFKTDEKVVTKGESDGSGPSRIRYHDVNIKLDANGKQVGYSSVLTRMETSPAIMNQFPSNSNSNSLAEQKNTSGIEKTTSGGLIKKTESNSTAANQNSNPLIVIIYVRDEKEPTEEGVEAAGIINSEIKNNFTKNNPGRNIIFIESFEQDKSLPKGTAITGGFALEGDKQYSNEEIQNKINERINQVGDK